MKHQRHIYTYLGFISPCTVLIVRETHRDLYSHMVTIVVTGKAMDKKYTTIILFIDSSLYNIDIRDFIRLYNNEIIWIAITHYNVNIAFISINIMSILLYIFKPHIAINPSGGFLSPSILKDSMKLRRRAWLDPLHMYLYEKILNIIRYRLNVNTQIISIANMYIYMDI